MEFSPSIFGECSSDKQHTDHTLIAYSEPSLGLDLRPAESRTFWAYPGALVCLGPEFA